MMIFFGRPLRTSFLLPMLLPMLLLHGRGFGQDLAPQQQSAPPASDGTPASAKPADSDAQKAPETKAEHAKSDQEAPPDKRVLGVLPNYRTVNETGTYEPITTKQKLIIAAKDSFDYPLVLLAGAFAGISQLDNSDKSYHQGVEGFAKRLAA